MGPWTRPGDVLEALRSRIQLLQVRGQPGPSRLRGGVEPLELEDPPVPEDRQQDFLAVDAQVAPPVVRRWLPLGLRELQQAQAPDERDTRFDVEFLLSSGFGLELKHRRGKVINEDGNRRSKQSLGRRPPIVNGDSDVAEIALTTSGFSWVSTRLSSLAIS